MQWTRINKATLKKREMKGMPMQSTKSRTRKFCTLDHPETSEVEVGGEGKAVTVDVSTGAVLAHPKPTRSVKYQLNKEPLRVLLQKAILH